MNDYVDFQRLGIGESLPLLIKDPITKIQLVRYAGASGDFNPLHTDDAFAKKAGLRGVIAHGPLIMGFVGQAVCRWIPKRSLKRLKVRFMGMTYPGDQIRIIGRVLEKREEEDRLTTLCEVFAEDDKGERKVSGEFEAVQPLKDLSR